MTDLSNLPPRDRLRALEQIYSEMLAGQRSHTKTQLKALAQEIRKLRHETKPFRAIRVGGYRQQPRST